MCSSTSTVRGWRPARSPGSCVPGGSPSPTRSSPGATTRARSTTGATRRSAWSSCSRDLTCLEKGYDLSQRRVDQPGFWPSGDDSVPVDQFGGWREHWSVYCVSYQGTAVSVPKFKDSDHPLAVHLRRTTQGAVTNPRMTGTVTAAAARSGRLVATRADQDQQRATESEDREPPAGEPRPGSGRPARTDHQGRGSPLAAGAGVPQGAAGAGPDRPVKPLVSVVVPAKDQEPHLGDCLTSLVGQLDDPAALRGDRDRRRLRRRHRGRSPAASPPGCRVCSCCATRRRSGWRRPGTRDSTGRRVAISPTSTETTGWPVVTWRGWSR